MAIRVGEPAWLGSEEIEDIFDFYVCILDILTLSFRMHIPKPQLFLSMVNMSKCIINSTYQLLGRPFYFEGYGNVLVGLLSK